MPTIKTVYRSPRAIPEIGAETGDHMIVRRGHADAPLAVVKRFGPRELAALDARGILTGPPPAPRHLTLMIPRSRSTEPSHRGGTSK